MANGFQRIPGDARRQPVQFSSSTLNRFENRQPMPNILCRNGPQCRKYQEGTCNYNHDFGTVAPNGLVGQKKSLNVDSPAFTPKTVNVLPAKNAGMSPKAAAAPNFTPRASGAVTPALPLHSKEPSIDFAMPQQVFQPQQQFSEFIPGQAFVPQVDNNSTLQSQLVTYPDPFLAQQVQQGISGLDGAQQTINPYAQTPSAVGGQTFFQDTAAFKHPLNYHLYASIGPKREKILPYQRSTSDFFISDELREDLQRKSEATLQTFANSTLPQSVEYFHSLVAMETNQGKTTSTFGYPSWVYKATSGKDGRTYTLRRIEGFRLTSEAAIRTIQAWKRVNNASTVQIYDAFTGRWFGDSSLIVVTDYHPLSQTLSEKYFGRPPATHRQANQAITEQDLWAYIVQLASALNAIHEAGLAGQIVQPSKVLITSKNRLRLNCCGVLDIIRYDQNPPLIEQQHGDLEDLGRLILGLATRNPVAYQSPEKALQHVGRTYSERLRACLSWLLSPPQHSSEPAASASEYTVSTLLTNIADKVVLALDSTLQSEDVLTNELMRELENGRLVRLLTKLNVILERAEPNTSSSSPSPSSSNPSAWSETGERYYLKLFRDYAFHQVDHEGRPVLDLGHIVTCLNKLDAGIDEKVQLVSRDEQNVFILSYREVKRAFEAAWAEISKASIAVRR